MDRKFLKGFRVKDKSYNQPSKFFNLLTNILLSGEINLGFTNPDKFKDFKKKVEALIYWTLCEKKLIKKTHSSLMKFQSISLTLTALTDYRYRFPTHFPPKNPTTYYTLSELSTKISPTFYRALLAEKLQTGSEAPQLLNVISRLNVGIRRGVDMCNLAKYAINRYMKTAKWSTSELSNIIHPLYEKVTIDYLNSKGVRCAHEVYVRFPREFRPDNMIERSENFKNNIEQFQNIVSIPDSIKLISVDYTYNADYREILAKCKKFYQSGDRMLVIVLLGDTEKHVTNYRAKLQQFANEDDGSLHLENVKILTSKEYGEFLGFDGHHAKTFDLYQRLSFKVFSSKRLLYDTILQYNMVEKELRALNEDWINTYLRQHK